ncbi:MAG: DUF302 domain-containing protein [Bacteroidales bacterium]|nr:DUF302 domain-containing protein [Bacteroidales bacterium]
MNYYIAKTLDISFEKAESRLAESLKTEGFGIVSEINMQAKLKEKLNVDFRRYKILGTCNPAFAHKALQLEDKIGTMLPCNFIIQETADGGVEVAAINPGVSMQAVGNSKLEEIAATVQAKLENIIKIL